MQDKREELAAQEAERCSRRERLAMPIDPDNGCIVDPSGSHNDTPQQAMYFGVLELCGCGRPEDVHALLVDCTKQFVGEFDDRSHVGGVERIVRERPEVVAEFIAHFLDQRGLIEHGSSVRYGWATDLGEQFAEVGPMTKNGADT